MAINKVVYGDDTLIDLTSDTITPSVVMAGYTFHNADGTEGTGNMSLEAEDISYDNSTSGMSADNVQDGIDSLSDSVKTLLNTMDTKADSATTLVGYGITDAYTKTEIDAKTAEDLSYDNSTSGMEADNVQSAIDEVLGKITGGIEAQDVYYDNYATELQVTDVQSAIDEIFNLADGKLGTSDIINNVTSTDTDKALSANQGKVLKDLVDTKLDTSDIVNNLTSTSTTTVLSAYQGKVLKDLSDTKVNTSDIIDNLNSTSSTTPLSANQGKQLRLCTESIIGCDEWTAKSYSVGDYVRYSTAFFVCIKATTSSIKPTNSTYWRQITFKTDKFYRTSEYITGGTWIDSKPIYRRVFTGTVPTPTSSSSFGTSTLGTISNLSEVTKIEGVIKDSSNGYMAIPNAKADGSALLRVRIDLSGNVIVENTNANVSGTTIKVVAEYTKSS